MSADILINDESVQVIELESLTAERPKVPKPQKQPAAFVVDWQMSALDPDD